MATLTVTPNPSVPSSTVNVHGAGFSGSQQIKLNPNGTNLKTQSDGTFDVALVVPSTAGNYTVSAVKGQTVLASTTFTVQVPAPPPPPATTVPGIPRNLTAVAGDSSITLNWIAPLSDGGAAIIGYKIYRGGVFLTQVSVVSTFTNVGLQNGTPYTYTVSAVNSVGEGAQSSPVAATPVAAAPPPPVPVISNIVESGLTGTSINVSWHTNVPAQGWIEYGLTTSYGSLTTKELSFNFQDLTQTISGLANGTLYHYKIHAVDQYANSTTSVDRTFTTTGAAITYPGAPLNLTATPGDAKVTLAWNPPTSNGGSAITGYRVYRNGSLLITLGNVTSYINTALTNGTSYTYAVSAMNSYGEGAKSSTAPATPTANFVIRTGATLSLNGQPFRFAGPNMYWLGLDENNGGSLGGVHYPTKYNIDDGLATAKEMGASVVRAHTLGISVGSANTIEPSLNTFNDAAFNTIDYAIYVAGQRGIRLIIPLTDGNAPCFYHGCIRTFVGWTYPGSTNDALFFTDTAVINNFKAYISHLLNHVNTYTGIALKNDPTIMAWESGNEIDTGATTTSWLNIIAPYVKSIDSNHLFVDGGWDMGSDRLSIASIDMYTRHHYTGGYYGTGAISDDQHYGSLAVAANKIYFAGEYDWTELHGAPLTLSTYLANVETYQSGGKYAITGDIYWSLFPHKDTNGFETHSDGYTLNYPGNTAAMRTKAQLFITHAHTMNSNSTGHIMLTAPLVRTPVNSGGMQIKWQGVAGAVYYQVERSNDSGSTWTVVSPASWPADGTVGGLSDNDPPWTDVSGTGSSTYRVRAFNNAGTPGPYSSGYNNSNSGPPA